MPENIIVRTTPENLVVDGLFVMVFSMKVLSLCGGKETRLRGETEFRRKPMLLIGRQSASIRRFVQRF